MLAPVQPLSLGPLELPRRGPLRVFYPKLYLGSSSFLSPEDRGLILLGAGLLSPGEQ